MTVLGGLDPEPAGLDLRGAFVGSEGTLGIATRIAVRLTPDPPAVATLLLDFAIRRRRGRDGQRHHRRRHPARRPRDDGPAASPQAAEDFAHAGYPTDAAAVLLVEVDGLPAGVADAVARIGDIGRAHGARAVRVAADDAERALLWKGRKSAFGAVARVAPNYYLHDTVVPRTRLVEVLTEVYAIAERHDLGVMNVFHAGDGNLHPLLLFDAREPGVMERVHAAGDEIVRVSLAAGGVLSGEHGIGLEKRDLMPLLFGPDDLDAQARLREAFDPDGVANPTKVLPAGQPVRRPAGGPRGRVGVMPGEPVTDPVGRLRRRGRAGRGRARWSRSAGRTQWDVGGAVRARTARRCGGAAAGRDRRRRGGRHDRPGAGRHHGRRPRRRPRRGRPDRGAARRGPAPPWAACWPSATAGSATSAGGRCATPCSRCATCRPRARS